jgi:hypothetical protein
MAEKSKFALVRDMRQKMQKENGRISTKVQKLLSCKIVDWFTENNKHVKVRDICTYTFTVKKGGLSYNHK